jgi:ribosomal protein L3 glutamine methyltransferase
MGNKQQSSERGLRTLADLVRWGAGRLRAARVLIGHSEDNAVDEARSLVLHALHLPARVPGTFALARLLDAEIAAAQALIERRIAERIPAAYLIGTAEFAGLTLRSDARALVPRSPIAELIENGFRPWLGDRPVRRVLDLCTGGGSIAVAMAMRRPDWRVDALDLSADALALAAENVALHGLGSRLRLLQSDLFGALGDEIYDLIVSNPPYITDAEYASMPGEYAHEPKLGLTSGADGCDACLRILRDAPKHLAAEGLLIVEVGEAERALKRLLPQLPLVWIEFSVGQMGVFALEAKALRGHRAAIEEICETRGL